MGLIFHKKQGKIEVLLWQIEHSLEEICSSLNIKILPFNDVKRNKEWANSCLLIKQVFANFEPNWLKKDEFGKPFIEGFKENISISHSKDKIALMLNYEENFAGIDVEFIDERIIRIEKKFVSNFDLTFHEKPLHQHLIWGAKEVLFKIHSIGNLNYLNHLQINQKDENKLFGKILKPNFEQTIELEFTVIDGFLLIWGGERI